MVDSNSERKVFDGTLRQYLCNGSAWLMGELEFVAERVDPVPSIAKNQSDMTEGGRRMTEELAAVKKLGGGAPEDGELVWGAGLGGVERVGG